MKRQHDRTDARVRRRPGRHHKPVLAVQAMAGETAWLDGALRWQSERVMWETEGGLFAPGPADLALAQRRLYQIAGYPVAARRAFGNVDAWLARRQARLVLAKRLQPLAVADWSRLLRPGAGREPAVLAELAGLLLAEALCLDVLPAAPSAGLAAAGAAAVPRLRDLADDPEQPDAARALAALVIGAIARSEAAGGRRAPAAPVNGADWLRRAYGWGVRAGLPPHAPLVVDLLADTDGWSLARRCLAALAAAGPFRPSSLMLRRALVGGAPAERVVALAEAAAAADPLARRMLRRGPLPARPAERRLVAAQQRRERQQAVAGLADLVLTYAGATPDPATVDVIVRFAGRVLDWAPLTPALAEGILDPLRAGLTLPARLQLDYLSLLADLPGYLAAWAAAHPPAPPPGLPERLGHLQHGARSLARLLSAAGDAAVAREALVAGIDGHLAAHQWADPDCYRWVGAMAREMLAGGSPHPIRFLCQAVDHFPDARAARAALQPLLQAIMSAVTAVVTGRDMPDDQVARARTHLREHLLETLLGALLDRSSALAANAAALPPFVPRIAEVAHRDQRVSCLCHPLVAGALALQAAVPDRAVVWFDWLVAAVIRPMPPTGRQHDEVDEDAALAVGITLGVALADGDLARFQAVVEAARRQRLERRPDLLERGVAALSRLPALRPPLAALVMRQARRCVALVERLGLATRLSAEDRAPLLALAQPVEPPGPAAWPADWRALVEAAPDLAPVAAAYLQARSHLDGEASVPPGVRQALEQPARLERELRYLEGRLAGEGARPDLAARAANLRARLAEGERVRQEALVETAARLRDATTEAQVAAAERIVLDCFRARLAGVAGPLPPGLALDDDLLNATLLTIDITHNRRQLIRLLRAAVRGGRDWRPRHPVNAAFLERLAAQGIDVGVWLSASPWRYPCAGVAGGRVRVYLERAPLRILQMGNYFDTCLSFGQVNAFSTVANAVELNKRVVYATDGDGRVIGRKLIGIAADGQLLGYHTYTALTHRRANAALRRIIRDYVLDFAGRCGLTPADSGTVPTLFVRHWYDDGAVPWSDGEADEEWVSPPGRPPPARSARSSSAPGPAGTLVHGPTGR